MCKRRCHFLRRPLCQLLRKTDVIARPTVKSCMVALHKIVESTAQRHRTISLYLQYTMVYPILKKSFTLKLPFTWFQY